VNVGDLRYSPKLRLADQAQASARVLNGTVSVVYDYEDNDTVETMVRLYRSVLRQRWADFRRRDFTYLVTHPLKVLAFGARHLGYSGPAVIKPRSIWLSCISEQAPNPDSRVTLSA